MLKSDLRPQPVILRCHLITSSRPGKLLPEEGLPFSWPEILLPEEGLPFLAGNTFALGGFTFPGREYFCLRRVYLSWPGIILPEEDLLFLAGNASALGRDFSLINIERFKKVLKFHKYSRLEFNHCHPGFPAGDGDHSFPLLAVYSLHILGWVSLGNKAKMLPPVSAWSSHRFSLT